MLPITDNALENMFYGFRAKIQNALVSPSSQDEPKPNRWNVVVIMSSGLHFVSRFVDQASMMTV